VRTNVSIGRLPAAIEATAYFIVAEALTNVAKHSRAERADIGAVLKNGALEVQVRDDGVGGAQRSAGGLLGLEDRLASLNGTLEVESPTGGGTVIRASIPLQG
jgi:signal transduction histidine kinase